MTDHHPPRRYPRHPVSIECDVEGASGRATMRLSELSVGGCYVDTRMQFSPDTAVTVRAHFPAAELVFTGRVVYMQPGFGFGMAFDPLPESTREQLNAFLIKPE